MLEKSGEGNGTPLQYSCLENPMDGGAWQAAVHGIARSWMRLSDFTFIFTFMHWRRKWQPTPVFLPGESQGWGSLVGCHLRGRTESDTTEATQQQQQQLEKREKEKILLTMEIKAASFGLVEPSKSCAHPWSNNNHLEKSIWLTYMRYRLGIIMTYRM